MTKTPEEWADMMRRYLATHDHNARLSFRGTGDFTEEEHRWLIAEDDAIEDARVRNWPRRLGEKPTVPAGARKDRT